MLTDMLVDELPTILRLALSYAPRRARKLTLGLMALDCRLAAIVRNSREPLLGQVRLAWWRDRLAESPAVWPEGEPLLGLLCLWGEKASVLSGLVDGWEAMLGESPLAGDVLARLADGRGGAFGGLAELLNADPEAAARAGRGWALVDLSGKLGDPQERAEARALAEQLDWSRINLPQSLRPLTVLHGLSRRAMRRGEGQLLATSGAGLVAMRLGLLGR